jgi:hypothetical protein
MCNFKFNFMFYGARFHLPQYKNYNGLRNCFKSHTVRSTARHALHLHFDINRNAPELRVQNE